jgi:PTS hybrid protein
VIGLVVVSHSPALAQAAVELALQMVQGERPAIAIAAGAGEGLIGTDAAAVASAIDEVASADGVLVIMDLGSAVMSAEMALDFRASAVEVRLSIAPFVEGLVAAIVTAAGGASLEDVDREACGALSPKAQMLGRPETAVPAAAAALAPAEPAPAPAEPAPSAAPPSGRSTELTIVNPDGLHARPAAHLVATLARLEAKVTIVNRRIPDRAVSASSLVGLLSLGTKAGDVITVTATGAEADEALATITRLVNDGFGEIDQ